MIKAIQSVISVLLTIVLLWIFGPVILYGILILLIFGVIWFLRFWYLSKTRIQQPKQQFDQSTYYNKSNQVSDDIIDVEYTERRINDDKQ